MKRLKTFLKKYEYILTFLFFLFLTIALFHPIFLQDKIALNTNFLVSFYSPWRFEKFNGFPAGVPAKHTAWDQLRLYYPWLTLIKDSISKGQIPFWNPYNFSGQPLMANWQSAIFYPLNIFLFILNPLQMWNLLRLAPFLLSGFFTYLYLRTIAIKKLPSLMGALSFMLSGFLITWGEEVIISINSICWLPLALFGQEQFFKTKQKKYLLVLIFSLISSILSGYAQTTIYLLAFVAIYPLFAQYGLKRSLSLLITLLSIVSSFALTAFQILPTLELYQLSSRAVVDASEMITNFFIPVYSLITYLAPDFFGNPTTLNYFVSGIAQYYERIFSIGVIPLMLAFLAINLKIQQRRLTLGLLSITIISVISTLDLPISRLPYLLKIPFVSTGAAGRILFIPAFSLSTLAAIGGQYLLKRPRRKTNILPCLLFALAFLGLILFLIRAYQKEIHYPPQVQSTRLPRELVIISARNLVIPLFNFLTVTAAIAIIRLKKANKYLIMGLIIFVSLTTNSYSFYKYISFGNKQFLYPSHPLISSLKDRTGYQRFWGYGDGYLENNFATFYRLYDPEGYDSLNLNRYGKLLYTANQKVAGKLVQQISRSDASLPRTPDGKFSDNTHRLRLLQLLGVKYILDRDVEFVENRATDPERFQGENYQLVWQQDTWRIFEYKKALPRVFLANNYIVIKDDQSIVDKLLDQTTDLRHTVILEEELETRPDFIKNTEGFAEIIDYSVNKVTIRTSSPSDKILFLNDNYYPGWQAKIDNHPTKIYRANFSFRAVPVSRGQHQVVFTFKPNSFYTGLKISWVTLIFLSLIILLPKLSRFNHLFKHFIKFVSGKRMS